MQDFRNVTAWKKAHALVLTIYRETQAFPKDEAFGVTLQLRRKAAAVAMQIAEGAGRSSNEEFRLDLRRAASGCNELEYLVLLAGDLAYWRPDVLPRLGEDVSEVRKVIFGLLRSF